MDPGLVCFLHLASCIPVRILHLASCTLLRAFPCACYNVGCLHQAVHPLPTFALQFARVAVSKTSAAKWAKILIKSNKT